MTSNKRRAVQHIIKLLACLGFGFIFAYSFVCSFFGVAFLIMLIGKLFA